jgi:hypothetical protein
MLKLVMRCRLPGLARCTTRKHQKLIRAIVDDQGHTYRDIFFSALFAVRTVTGFNLPHRMLSLATVERKRWRTTHRFRVLGSSLSKTYLFRSKVSLLLIWIVVVISLKTVILIHILTFYIIHWHLALVAAKIICDK